MFLASQSKQPYSQTYYEVQQIGSRQSADATVPVVLDLIQPRSVVDVGCGVGTWLAVFREHGVQDILGLDGDYVAREMLQVPADAFAAQDLTQPVQLGRRFDLALCLEVAEHLEPEHAPILVDSLTQLAPVILFSAAIPLQGGTQHVNEQWPDYWAALFEAKGFVAVDAVRQRIWNDDAIEPHYRQNILLYCAPDAFSAHPILEEAYQNTNPHLLSIVHPQVYLTIHPQGQAFTELSAWTRQQAEMIQTQQSRIVRVEKDWATMHDWTEQQDETIHAQQAQIAELEHSLAEARSQAQQQKQTIQTQQARIGRVEHDWASMHDWTEQQAEVIQTQQVRIARVEEDWAAMHDWTEQQAHTIQIQQVHMARLEARPTKRLRAKVRRLLSIARWY